MSRVAFALDGVVYNSVSISDGARFWPVPYFLILSTQLGGSWPGSVSRATVFPQFMRVDSIHVVQSTRAI